MNEIKAREQLLMLLPVKNVIGHVEGLLIIES